MQTINTFTNRDLVINAFKCGPDAMAHVSKYQLDVALAHVEIAKYSLGGSGSNISKYRAKLQRKCPRRFHAAMARLCIDKCENTS